MGQTTPRDGKPGTTDQSPRWEGPEETTPRGYLPALDDPAHDRDAAGENLNDPDRRTMGDAFTMREEKSPAADEQTRHSASVKPRQPASQQTDDARPAPVRHPKRS